MDDDEEEVPSFLRTVAVEEDTAYVLGIHEEDTRILTNDTLMAEVMLGEAWCLSWYYIGCSCCLRVPMK